MTTLGSQEIRNVPELIRRLLKLPAETPWVEFKVDKATSGEDIAKYVCALGNSARLHDEPAGFLVWGIDDHRNLVGTNFNPVTAKGKGNEDLYPWLSRVLSPAPKLQITQCTLDGHALVVLRVPAAVSAPYAFQEVRYFRKGSYNKKLIEFPNDEHLLWQKLQQFTIEKTHVISEISPQEITELLNPEGFFANRPELPKVEGDALLHYLQTAGAIEYSVERGWSIPLWSALMYARKLSVFPELMSYIPRAFRFKASDRLDLLSQWDFDEGYALSFPKIVELFHALRPGGSESINDSGVRVETPVLPVIAFREVLANALMHQDLDARGTFLDIEFFEDRVEVSNPGKPLVDPRRFIDTASTTRNPKLGTSMRQAHFVEQRGSGWDKIVDVLENQHFPPATTHTNGSTVVTLNAFRPYALMTTDERIIAIYQHTCLTFIKNKPVNNASIRLRFNLSDAHKSKISRLISETVEAGLIVPYDPSAGPRALRYVPFWADVSL